MVSSTPVPTPAPGVQPLQQHDPRRIGPYQVLGLLGAGGMGAVYLAAGHGHLAAVKLVHPGLATNGPFRARFAREVEAGRQVRSPWTAAVLDADPGGAAPWLATEYVPGLPLSQAVTTTGPLPMRAVATLAAHMAHALVAIHGAGLVHRDLKPANVLLAPDRPKLIDFGIARALDATRMTRSGTAIGTPAFMSPEQADGAETGTASDVFSLGSMLVWAATGKGPYGHGTPIAVVRRILTTPPELGALAGPLRDLVAECLRRNPAERPTAGELIRRLPAASTGPGWLPPTVTALLPDPAALPRPVPSPPAPVPRRVSRRRVLLGLGVVAGAAAAGGGGAVSARLWGGERARPSAALRWTYRVPGPVRDLSASDGVVYAAGPDAQIHAIDAGTGTARWTHAMVSRENINAPLVADGQIYVSDMAELVALGSDGARRWQADGAPIAAGGGIVVGIGVTEFGRDLVTGYDAATGAQRWTSAVDGVLGSGRAADLAGVTLGAAGGGRAHIGLKNTLRTLDTATGATVWEQQVNALTSVTVADRTVFCTADGPDLRTVLVAFDAATGQERWRRTAELSYGPVTVHDGTVYLDSGSTGLAALDARTGAPRWELGPGGPRYGTRPVVTGGTCYLGGRGAASGTGPFTLFAYDTVTGEQRWSLDLALDTAAATAIALAGDTVVLGSQRTGDVLGISEG